MEGVYIKQEWEYENAFVDIEPKIFGPIVFSITAKAKRGNFFKNFTNYSILFLREQIWAFV